jgi:hypothetical protein
MRAAKHPHTLNWAPAREMAHEILDPPADVLTERGEHARAATFALARPRRFARVPTHVVGVVNERRDYPRAMLGLPLKVNRVAGQRAPNGAALVSVNISSSGVFFLSPHAIEPGTPLEVQVHLVERPRGRGSVHMLTQAHVVRVVPSEVAGWYGLGLAFDEITFHRDDAVPLRYHKP